MLPPRLWDYVNCIFAKCRVKKPNPWQAYYKERINIPFNERNYKIHKTNKQIQNTKKPLN